MHGRVKIHTIVHQQKHMLDTNNVKLESTVSTQRTSAQVPRQDKTTRNIPNYIHTNIPSPFPHTKLAETPQQIDSLT